MDGLQIKVCVRTYRLFFVADTEDYLYKLRDPEESQKARKQLRLRNMLRKKWIDEQKKPKEKEPAGNA